MANHNEQEEVHSRRTLRFMISYIGSRSGIKLGITSVKYCDKIQGFYCLVYSICSLKKEMDRGPIQFCTNLHYVQP